MALDVISPRMLLGAYAQGVFPMACGGEIQWFSPEKRGVIPLDERFHVPHGLKRALRKKPFEVRVDTAFSEVMKGCSEREETWIDARIRASYEEMHRLGHAHSMECWDADGLQGGLYGVELPGVFFGESMFSRKPDASKIALVALVEHLRSRGFLLLDTQWMTAHLRQFGGLEISRSSYLKRLQTSLSEGSQRFSSFPSEGNPL